MIKSSTCDILFREGMMHYNCETGSISIFDQTMWWTGLIFWTILCIAFIIIFIKFLWNVLGAFLFTLKTIKRLPDNYTFLDALKFFWARLKDDSPSIRSRKTGLVVYKPWPWLSTKRRKEIEAEYKFRLPA